MADPQEEPPIREITYRFRPLWVIVVILALVAAGLVLWLVVLDDDDPGSGAGGPAGPQVPRGGAVASSYEELQSLPADVGHEVYWAGEIPDASPEITQTGDGRVYLRYLTGGAQAGDERSTFLTVGTYEIKDAYKSLQGYARLDSSQVYETPDGALVVTNALRPTSVYLSYPDSNLQIEVYDPDPTMALELATSGKITPIE